MTEAGRKGAGLRAGGADGGAVPTDTLELVIRKGGAHGRIRDSLLAVGARARPEAARAPAVTALMVCAAYAASDEFHQCFSDGRGPSPVD